MITLEQNEQNSLFQLYEDNMQQGAASFEKKEFFRAVLFFARALAIAEIVANNPMILNAKMEIANVEFKSRNLKEAEQLYTELLSYKNVLSEEDFIQAKNRLGIIKMRMGRYQEAAEIFEDIFKCDNPVAKRKAYNNMGVLYYQLHMYFEQECMDKAIQCFKQAFDLCQDDQVMQHKLLRNIGIAFYEKKDYTTALRKLKESLLLVSDDKVELANTLNELAKVYIELHDYDQALTNLREAEKILLNKNYRNLEELSRNIYIHGLLAKKQGRVETAFSHFQTALQGFVEKEIYPEAVMVCKAIYEMFKNSHPERASFYLDQYQFYLNYLDPMDT